MLAGCRCCFKGGGAIRGPQSSGLVLGKESWVAACRDNAFPNRAVGRPMKVCKEEIVGLAAAVVRMLFFSFSVFRNGPGC